MVRSFVPAILVFTFALGMSLPKHADACGPKSPPKKNVKVTVVVILGSYHSTKTDKRLVRIAGCIKDYCKKRRCKNLKGFQLASMECRSLTVNEKLTFKLVENQRMDVIIKQPTNKNNKVILAVYPPQMKGITYRTVCGKFLPIVTPYHTKNGHRLIVAIRVRPCNGGK